jgi:hypothetical protein
MNSARAILLVLIVSACASIVRAASSAETAPGPIGGPVERPHPWLFLNAEEVASAREKIASQPWARDTFEQLRDQAEEDLSVELPVFERDWWVEAREKPWRDIYPEIARHTMFVPQPAILAARRLAQFAQLADDGERYAKRAREILLHYTDYTFEFEHYDVGMNYAIWGVPALDVYDLLYDRFSAGERSRIDAFFQRFLDAVYKNDRYWVENEPGGRFNNHYAFHKQAIAAVGLFYGRDDLVRYAIDSPEGVRDLMVNGIRDDGLWLEGSLHYHFTPLYGLVPLAEMFRHAGGPIDLYRAEFEGGHTLKQLFDAPLEIIFPDGLVPNIGDGYGRDIYLQDVYLYEYAYTAWRDPRYAWLLKRPSPAESRARDLEGRKVRLLWGTPPGETQAPDVRSRVFPEHGYVMLRSVEGREYWYGKGFAAFLTFDRAGIHSHLDKLGLILWGNGRLLAQDVESRPTEGHAFSSQVQRELNRRTLCSNTVVVDGRDQRSVPQLLELVDFASTPGGCRATIADREGLLYPGVRQARTVVVQPGRATDIFRVESDKPHTFDWTLHPLDADGRTSSTLDFEALPDAPSPAPGWVRNGRRAQTDGPWTAEWEKDGVRLHLSMNGAPGTEVWLWDFPRDDRFSSPSVPMLQCRCVGRAAEFVAVYEIE